MDFKVGVGKSDFAALRESENYYVDKTELIYELVNDTDNEVTLFTRPRRFGKTLIMSMMENFFSIRKNSESIFEGLAITEHEDFCKEWMNQYPVLFLTFFIIRRFSEKSRKNRKIFPEGRFFAAILKRRR